MSDCLDGVEIVATCAIERMPELVQCVVSAIESWDLPPSEEVRREGHWRLDFGLHGGLTIQPARDDTECASFTLLLIRDRQTDLVPMLKLLEAIAPIVDRAAVPAPWGNLAHLPRVALLHTDVATVVRRDDMPRYYRPDLQWPEGISVRELGDRLMMTRLLFETDRARFQEAALAQNMALWFQSAPGVASRPAPPREGAPARGPAMLFAVGLDEATGVVEYAADLGPDERVQWWEIAVLGDQVATKRLSDGQPITNVRVVFSDLEAAFANVVPLVDSGVEVLVYDNDGDLVEVVFE